MKRKITKRILYILVSALLLLLAMRVGVVLGVGQSTPNSIRINAIDIHNLINQQRQQNGLAPLAYNTDLQTAAVAKCEDMLTRNYYAHTTPDGQQFYVLIYKLVNVPGGKYVGQNLVNNTASSQQTVSEWMNSPEHKANILNKHYNAEGIGFCTEPDGYDYVVEDFAQL